MKKISFKKIIYFGFCIVFIGCGQDKKNSKSLQMGYKSWMHKQLVDKELIIHSNDDLVEIEIPDSSGEDCYVTPVKFVKLCPKEEELIGTVDKLILYKNKLILLDKLTNTIFILNEDGSFNTKIHYIGKANEEFIKIGDFCLDEEKQLIIIKDVQLKKILYYNFKGQFVKALRSPIWLKEFVQLQDGSFCLLTLGNNLSGYNVLFTDSLHQLTSKSLLSHNRYKLNLFSHSLMHKSKEEVTFSYPFSNCFFCVNKDSLKLKYHLKFGENGFMYNSEKHKTMMDFTTDKKDLWFSLGGFVENQDYALFSLNRGNKGSTCVWFKNSQRSHLLNLKLKNSFPLTFPENIYNEYFISVLPSERLVIYKNELIKEYDLEEFYDEFTENSNPVLLYYKLEL